MERMLIHWKETLEQLRKKVEKDKLEEEELSGNSIENIVSKINLSENCDLSRLRYDYGIRLKNDSIVKVKSNQLIINNEGILYFLDEQKNEELEVGKVEDYLYEFDIFKQEWIKADVINILVNMDFSIKRIKEADKRIMEKRHLDFYTDIHNKNFAIRGVGVYERQ